MTDAYDPFSWDGGLTDNVDFTVASSRFGYNANIGGGETLLLIWKGKTVDHDTHDTVDAEAEQFFSCGKGWETFDSGTKARREDGKQKSFNGQTAVAKLVDAAVECGVKSTLAERGGPLVSTIWEGLTFHLRQHETDYGGDIGKKSRLLPVAVVNTVAGAGNTTPEAPAAAGNGNGKPSSNAPLLAKLRTLAKAAGDNDEFIVKAFDVDGLAGSDYEGQVIDGSLFEAANA